MTDTDEEELKAMGVTFGTRQSPQARRQSTAANSVPVAETTPIAQGSLGQGSPPEGGAPPQPADALGAPSQPGTPGAAPQAGTPGAPSAPGMPATPSQGPGAPAQQPPQAPGQQPPQAPGQPPQAPAQQAPPAPGQQAAQGGGQRPAAQGTPNQAPALNTLVGSVSSASGTALARATVTLTGEGGRQVSRVVSTEDGRYRLEVPRAGTYTAIVAAPGFRPVARTLSVGVAGTAQDFVLVGSGGVAGLVRSGSGVALRGTRVTLVDANGDLVAEAVDTDDQGRFSFAGVPEGAYTATAVISGHQPATSPVLVRAGAEARVELFLVGAGELSGIVRSAANGTPLAGATVALVDPDGQVVRAVITSQDGGYSFTDLAAGNYTVVASGYEPVASAVEVEAGSRRSADLALGGRSE